MKINPLTIIIQAIILVFLFSCNINQIKFDKTKWNEQSDPLFPPPYRKEMLTDLLTNNKLRGLKYSQVIGLLGIPDFKDSSSFSYNIIIDYKNDIDPVYIKKLNFIYTKDSVIRSFRIDEWRK